MDLWKNYKPTNVVTMNNQLKMKMYGLVLAIYFIICIGFHSPALLCQFTFISSNSKIEFVPISNAKMEFPKLEPDIFRMISNLVSKLT